MITSQVFSLTGRAALITGGAGGFGTVFARALAQAGADVALVGRNKENLDTAASALAAETGRRVIGLTADVADERQVADAVGTAQRTLGSVDILINNAGGSRQFGKDATEAQWHEAMTLNFTRPRQLTHKLLDPMIAGKWGRIINITGKSEPDGVNGAFSAKAGIHAWAKGLSREVGKFGITINSIPPGRIISEQILRNYTPEYRKWQEENEIPVGRYGQPEDVAGLVSYLVSPLGGYITGTVIPVDGGLRRYQF